VLDLLREVYSVSRTVSSCCRGGRDAESGASVLDVLRALLGEGHSESTSASFLGCWDGDSAQRTLYLLSGLREGLTLLGRDVGGESAPSFDDSCLQEGVLDLYSVFVESAFGRLWLLEDDARSRSKLFFFSVGGDFWLLNDLFVGDDDTGEGLILEVFGGLLRGDNNSARLDLL
jgi:hypothetical protein